MVRIWGAGAIDLVKELFRPYGTIHLDGSRPGRLRLGRIGAGLGDEVVGAVLATAIPAVELQCHGGTAAVSLVQGSLERAGAQRRERWELAGFDYPAGDDLAAQALHDLAKAPTVQTAEILLDQAQGALRAEISRLADILEAEGLRGLAGLDALIERGALGAAVAFRVEGCHRGTSQRGKEPLAQRALRFSPGDRRRGAGHNPRCCLLSDRIRGLACRAFRYGRAAARRQARSSGLAWNERGRNSPRLIWCYWSSTGRRACGRSIGNC